MALSTIQELQRMYKEEDVYKVMRQLRENAWKFYVSRANIKPQEILNDRSSGALDLRIFGV